MELNPETVMTGSPEGLGGLGRSRTVVAEEYEGKRTSASVQTIPAFIE
jgi:hypothetical protein